MAGQTNAVRHGEYFAKELTLANTNSAVYTSLVTVAMLTTSTNGEPVQATSSTTGTGTVSTAAASTSGNGNTGNKPQWLYNEQGQLIKKLPNGKEQVMPGTAGGNNVSGGGTVSTLNESNGVTTISVSLTNTGHAFLPKTPEMFTHDEDGNLTSDGRWQYSWDAENRLIGMETTTSAASNGVPRQKLLFGYDHQSRRISKLVSDWTGGSWSEISNLKFVYDGWNLLGEVNGTNAILRTYAWGLDLSGTEQGAGGIGGLLWMTSHQSPSTSHFASFDGNGNVAALLNSVTGQVSAEYEYSPFGETIRATGPAASQNVFWFSNKYTDTETGLLYYGYRYYRPTAGKWLSRDPIEEEGGPSPQLFVANAPLGAVDMLGLKLDAFTTDPATMRLTQAEPVARNPRAWAKIHFSAFPFLKTGIVWEAPCYCKISGTLKLTLHYDKTRPDPSNDPAPEGGTIAGHEQQHARDSIAWWTALKSVIDPIEGWHSPKCALLAQGVRDAAIQYYQAKDQETAAWRDIYSYGSRSPLPPGRRLASPDADLAAALRSLAVLEARYWAAIAAFKAAKC